MSDPDEIFALNVALGRLDVADVYPGWRGITQRCDVCGRLVAVNAVSPSEIHCSEACGLRAYGIDAPTDEPPQKGSNSLSDKGCGGKEP